MDTDTLTVNLDVDTSRLDAALAEMRNHRQPFTPDVKPTLPVVRSKRRRAGKSPSIATRRPRRGRQVLIPGRRKAARHPWADRLAAARTGGFAVGQIFTGTSRVTACCFACGERFTIDAATATEADKFGFEAECRRHEARECVRVTA